MPSLSNPKEVQMSVVLAVIVLAILGILLGLGLAVANRVFAVKTDPRIDAVNAALPQVNCGACGYAGCETYAEAVVNEGVVGSERSPFHDLRNFSALNPIPGVKDGPNVRIT